MVGLRYAPGSAHLIATGGAVVLIDAGISTDLLTRIWREVDEGRGLAAVLEALSGAFGTSLTAIPPFVVAVAESDGVRLAVRGDILVTVEGPAGVENITGTGVTTWSERSRPGGAHGDPRRSGPSTAPAIELPLRDGVVRAAALVAEWADAAAPAPARVVPFSGSTTGPVHDDGLLPPDSRGTAAEPHAPILRTVQAEDEPAEPARAGRAGRRCRRRRRAAAPLLRTRPPRPLLRTRPPGRGRVFRRLPPRGSSTRRRC